MVTESTKKIPRNCKGLTAVGGAGRHKSPPGDALCILYKDEELQNAISSVPYYPNCVEASKQESLILQKRKWRRNV